MLDLKNKPVRALITIMIVLTIIGITIAWFYYQGENQSVDPRIREARTLYEKYNQYAQLNHYDSVLILMDSIERIYQSVDHYKNSFEIGVLNNNRAATILSLYLQKYQDDTDSIAYELINKAENATLKSIHIYKNWFEKYGDKNKTEIEKMIKDDFLRGLENQEMSKKEQFLETRVEELQNAVEENKRRLSVSYTNLGLIKRHQMKYDSAALYYKKAIDLWDRNLTAENNLNILLNRPLKKRNMIQKLFPPDKDK